jgi:hypothetical protein
VGGGSFQVLGGEIADIGGEGVLLDGYNGDGVTLQDLTITDPESEGILANGVNNLSMIRVSMSGAGWESGGHGIDISNALGTLTIEGTTVTGSDLNNVMIELGGDDALDIVVDGSEFYQADNNGFEVAARNAAQITLDVQGSTFDDNGTSLITDERRLSGMVLAAHDDALIDVTVGGTSGFHGNGRHGLLLFDTASARLDIDIDGNGFSDNGIFNENGYGLRVIADHTTTSSAGISGFVTDNIFSENYSGGLLATLVGDSRNFLEVSGNTVVETTADAGMAFDVGEPTNGSSSEATLNLLLDGNDISVDGGLTGASDALRVQTRGNNEVCLAATDGTNIVTVDVLDAAVETTAAGGSVFNVEELSTYANMTLWITSRFDITTGDAWLGKVTGAFTSVPAGDCGSL